MHLAFTTEKEQDKNKKQKDCCCIRNMCCSFAENGLSVRTGDATVTRSQRSEGTHAKTPAAPRNLS